MDFFNKLTSSLASTTNSYGGLITRVLSFTGSFNDRTSLLREHDDAELGGRSSTQTEAASAPPPPPPTTAPEAAAAPAAAPPGTTPTAAGHSIDIEAAGHEEDPGSDQQQDAESKRVGKAVQTVCLFAASASLVLFVNLPSQQRQPGAALPPPALLYGADMAFIVLGFFSSLGLSMFSIVARPGGEKAAAVASSAQKWGMVVAVASVVVAFTLRVCMVPAAGV
ncbi:hypothetical protein ZEAMMB73_Zm00001d039527 [Zea mays]|jgi:hypothetical protein|uniref:Uncharacterized protein n=1 Tax=Zea mays TaxID=4577 RepID=A0A1D6MI04_MAIZE|nr:hypothetical protein ZEAMMB73_Zm00001d039527 [Zea mays]